MSEGKGGTGDAVPWRGEQSGAPPGWYADPVDPVDPAAYRWWDGQLWTERRAVWIERGPSTVGPGERPKSRRSAWAVAVGLVACFIGVALLIGGGVRIDQSSGRFGRITVPGQSYGLPDIGTYVIADGDYAAGMHRTPEFEVTGPSGESIPVEEVPGHRYASEDNALAIFRVVERGRHRLEVARPEGARGDLPSTVTVNRAMDGTGEPLTSAYVAVGVGLLLLVVGGTALIVGAVWAVRVRRA